MPHQLDPPPPRWRELCSDLQRENNPAKFQSLIEELDRLMTAHEKRTLGSLANNFE